MAFVRQIAKRVTVLHLGRGVRRRQHRRDHRNEDVRRIYLGKV